MHSQMVFSVIIAYGSRCSRPRDRSRGDSSYKYRAIRHGSIKFPLKIGLKAANFPGGRDNYK